MAARGKMRRSITIFLPTADNVKNSNVNVAWPILQGSDGINKAKQCCGI